ncbi:MAG: hypothetical protein R2855_02735 [Thermomicrobiales bacterium]
MSGDDGFHAKMLAVTVLAAVVPGLAVTAAPAMAQSGLDGAACWPQGR